MEVLIPVALITDFLSYVHVLYFVQPAANLSALYYSYRQAKVSIEQDLYRVFILAVSVGVFFLSFCFQWSLVLQGASENIYKGDCFMYMFSSHFALQCRTVIYLRSRVYCIRFQNLGVISFTDEYISLPSLFHCTGIVIVMFIITVFAIVANDDTETVIFTAFIRRSYYRCLELKIPFF